jgi:ATP-dependent DNA helicase RecG
MRGFLIVTFNAQIMADGATQPKSWPESQPESSTSPALVQYQSLEERVLTLLGQGALPVSILSRRLGQKRVSGQLKVVLKKLLSDALIEFTIPDKPNSRLQKYRLAPEGEKALTERGGEEKK